MGLIPCLEDPSRPQDPVVFLASGKQNLGMLLPLPVPLECVEALHLQGAHPSDHLALARPDSHHRAANFVLFRSFGLLDYLLAKLLNFVLLEAQHCVASASLTLDYLSLLNRELLLAGQEVLQGIGPKADKQLI